MASDYTGCKPIIVWTGEYHSGSGDLLWEPHEFDSMYQARVFMAQDGSRHILTYTDEAVVTERARDTACRCCGVVRGA